MPEEYIFICNSGDLTDGGKGIRFPVTAIGEDTSGFVVRYNSLAHAYLNRCARADRARLDRRRIFRVQWPLPDVFDAWCDLCPRDRSLRRRSLSRWPLAAYYGT
jgi:hypothetical protein